LDITDAVVSIDAAGCQHEIAKQIVDKGGHYLLSLKKNQQELYNDVVCGFKACSAESVLVLCTKYKYQKIGNTITVDTRPVSVASFNQKARYCQKIKNSGAD
jgi:predicted transposase YbfD/YdcC